VFEEAREIVTRSSEFDNINDFNNILNYMFININGGIMPSQGKISNILNIFFYKGNLQFTYDILLSDNIYNMIEKPIDKPSKIYDTILKDLTAHISTTPNINLETVIEFITKIKGSATIDPLKTKLVELITKLYSNEELQNCTHIYNYLYIYDIIEKLEADYNKHFDISNINRRLKELNKMVEKPSNEAKIPFYFICDILKCKVLFDRVDSEVVRYGINTFMALMIKNTNIPFNMNIFTKHATRQNGKVKIKTKYEIPINNVEHIL